MHIYLWKKEESPRDNQMLSWGAGRIAFKRKEIHRGGLVLPCSTVSDHFFMERRFLSQGRGGFDLEQPGAVSY